MSEKIKEWFEIGVLVVIAVVVISVRGHIYAKNECQKYGYTGEGAGLGLNLDYYCQEDFGNKTTLNEAKSEWETKQDLQSEKLQEENRMRLSENINWLNSLKTAPPTMIPPEVRRAMSTGPTFHGYNCLTQDCSGHKAGYSWAEENDISDEHRCDGNSNSFNEGCMAYIEENN